MPDHPTFLRLLKPLSTAAGTTSRSGIARWLDGQGLPTSPQGLNNWAKRGVPDAACLHLGKLLSCDPVWLFYGEGNENSPLIARQSQPDYTPEEVALLRGFRHADITARRTMLFLANSATEDFIKRTGTN